MAVHTQAAIILNHENVNILNIGQGEARRRKYKKAETWWRSGALSINCLDSGYNLEQCMNSSTICCTKPGLQA